LTLGAVVVFIYRVVARAGALRRYRLTKFAVRNGMLYSTTSTRPRFHGTIFNVGNARAVFERLWSDTDMPIELGNYRYTTGSVENKAPQHRAYLAVRLPRRRPDILLDDKGNNSLFGSNLRRSGGRDQRRSLEGNFDEYLTLFCPREDEADALYVFTPDLMA